MNKKEIQQSSEKFVENPQPISVEQEIEQNLVKDITERTISQNGLVADSFDEAPTIAITDTQWQEFENRQGIHITYEFRPEEVKKALQIFQRYTIYKKNIICSLIIAILFVCYLIQVVQQPDSKMGVFMCVLTVAALGFIWYFPFNHIHQTVKILQKQKQQEQYQIIIYDNALIVGEGEQQNVLYYKDQKLRVWETSDLFIIGYQKAHVFILPKRCCYEQVENISKLLSENLPKDYLKLDG